MKTQLLAATAAFALLTGAGLAQDATSTAPADTTTTTTTTTMEATGGAMQPMAADQAVIDAAMAVSMAEEFVTMAASGNMFEIQSSELAVNQAEAQEVKDFAQHMIEDHTAAGERMMAAVQEAGLTVEMPTMLAEHHQMMLDMLQPLQGAEFDSQYVTAQVAAHEEAVALHTAYAENGDNETLRALATEMLPTLQEHLQEATALHESMMAQ